LHIRSISLQDGEYALIEAARHGCTAIVKLLLEAGAAKEIINRVSSTFRFLLYYYMKDNEVIFHKHIAVSSQSL